MPITLPQIDARASYREILAEALARIPVHNPEWTNFNDSDPGVTLLQLFAFMSENLIYRSSFIPERNRLKFLQLLGMPLQPAAAAKGLVTLSNERGPVETVTLPAGLELSAGKVPFRMEKGLDVLPVETQVYYKRRLPEERAQQVRQTYAELYASLLKEEDQPDLYETAPMSLPASNAALPALDLAAEEVVDHSLWIALLARSGKLVAATREAIAQKTVSLGILPALAEAPRVLRPGGSSDDENQMVLRYLIPDAPPNGIFLENEPHIPRYDPLPARAEVNVLERHGVVELTLPGAEKLQLWRNLEPLEEGSGDFPPALEDTNVAARLVTWIRIQIPKPAGEERLPAHIHARLSWVGVNTATVSQRVYVPAEVLGKGNGEPDQVFRLVNTPVITEPAGSLKITVGGDLWYQIDDLFAAQPEVPTQATGLAADHFISDPRLVKVFQVDRESGAVIFGDGRHGARPPAGASIQASYYYGGGRAGMVGIGAINKGAALPTGMKVSNPIPAFGGDEAETVAEAEKRIPFFLRHRDRLITVEDFRDVTWQTPGVDLGRVEILPLFLPELPAASSPGVVTVMVIPRFDPLHPEAPEPDQLFLDTICDYLDARRLLTTEVHVLGPEYVDLFVAVGIEVFPGFAFAPVREDLIRRMREVLSPLRGGLKQTGWPLEKTVDALELLAEAARVAGVALVRGVRLANAAGQELSQIPLVGLQLPRLAGLVVSLGQPDSPVIQGEIVVTPTKLFPVPVVPEVC